MRRIRLITTALIFATNLQLFAQISADANSVPWMAAITYEGNETCAAVYIGDKWLLTSASYFIADANGHEFDATKHKIKFISDPNNDLTIESIQISPHRAGASEPISSDIALIKLVTVPNTTLVQSIPFYDKGAINLYRALFENLFDDVVTTYGIDNSLEIDIQTGIIKTIRGSIDRLKFQNSATAAIGDPVVFYAPDLPDSPPVLIGIGSQDNTIIRINADKTEDWIVETTGISGIYSLYSPELGEIYINSLKPGYVSLDYSYEEYFSGEAIIDVAFKDPEISELVVYKQYVVSETTGTLDIPFEQENYNLYTPYDVNVLVRNLISKREGGLDRYSYSYDKTFAFFGPDTGPNKWEYKSAPWSGTLKLHPYQGVYTDDFLCTCPVNYLGGKWAITTASCFDTWPLDNLGIVFGSQRHKLSGVLYGRNEEVFSIKQIVTSTGNQFGDNITLIELDESPSDILGDHVKPIPYLAASQQSLGSQEINMNTWYIYKPYPFVLMFDGWPLPYATESTFSVAIDGEAISAMDNDGIMTTSIQIPNYIDTYYPDWDYNPPIVTAGSSIVTSETNFPVLLGIVHDDPSDVAYDSFDENISFAIELQHIADWIHQITGIPGVTVDEVNQNYVRTPANFNVEPNDSGGLLFSWKNPNLTSDDLSYHIMINGEEYVLESGESEFNFQISESHSDGFFDVALWASNTNDVTSETVHLAYEILPAVSGFDVASISEGSVTLTWDKVDLSEQIRLPYTPSLIDPILHMEIGKEKLEIPIGITDLSMSRSDIIYYPKKESIAQIWIESTGAISPKRTVVIEFPGGLTPTGNIIVYGTIASSIVIGAIGTGIKYFKNRGNMNVNRGNMVEMVQDPNQIVIERESLLGGEVRRRRPALQIEMKCNQQE